MKSDADQFLDELIELDGSQVIEWVENATSGITLVPDNFNWLGLAEIGSIRATSTLDLEWANVAIRIYEYLSTTNVEKNETFLVSAMFIRANLIVSLGSKPGDDVLDPAILVSWFRQNLKIPFEIIDKSVTRGWQKLPIEEISYLRKLKNRVMVIRLLQNLEAIQSNQGIMKWVNLFPKLP